MAYRLHLRLWLHSWSRLLHLRHLGWSRTSRAYANVMRHKAFILPVVVASIASRSGASVKHSMRWRQRLSQGACRQRSTIQVANDTGDMGCLPALQGDPEPADPPGTHAPGQARPAGVECVVFVLASVACSSEPCCRQPARSLTPPHRWRAPDHPTAASSHTNCAWHRLCALGCPGARVGGRGMPG
jgi:hypothetical protein